MSTQVINPVEAEWIEAVYKLTSTTPKSKSNGGSGSDDNRLKEKLTVQHNQLEKRLQPLVLKGAVPISLAGKLTMVGEDLKAGYKVTALEGRLKEIEEQIGVFEKQPFKPGSLHGDKWNEEVSRNTDEFRQNCKEVEGGLLKQAQQRAQELAKTEKGERKQKRLAGLIKETRIDFISVPLERLYLRFDKDFDLGGEAKKNETVKTYKEELKQTKSDIEKLIAGDGFIRAVGLDQKDKEKSRLVEARKKAAIKIAELRELNGTLAKRYAELVERADTPEKVEVFENDIILTVQRSRDGVKLIHEGVKKTIAEHSKAIDELAKGKEGVAKDILARLKEELARTEMLAATGNLKAADAVDKLGKRIAEAAKAATVPNSEVAKRLTEIDRLKKELAKPDVGKLFPNDLAAAKKLLDQVVKDTDPLDPESSKAAFEKARESVLTLTAKAKALADWQTRIHDEMESLEGDVTKLMGGRIAKVFGKDTKMAMLVDEINAAYVKPDVDKEAVLKLQADLIGRVNKLVKLKDNKTELNKGLETEKQEAQQEKENREREEKDKAKKLEEFNEKADKSLKELDEVAKEVTKADGPVDEVDTAREFADLAKKLAKGGDLKEAGAKLELCDKRISELKSNPGGVVMQNVKDLAGAPAKWKEAIGPILATLKEISEEAAKVAQGSGIEAGKVSDKIKPIQEIFALELFTAPIANLTEGSDENKKKAAREKVLAEIRNLRSQLHSNEVLKVLRRNPFKKKIATGPVTKFLASLELNALRAVRE